MQRRSVCRSMFSCRQGSPKRSEDAMGVDPCRSRLPPTLALQTSALPGAGGVDSDFGPTLCRVVRCLPRPAAAPILNPLGKLGRRLFDRMRGSKSMAKIKVAQPVVELDGDER